MNQTLSAASTSHEMSLAIPAENLRQLVESILECTGTLPGWPVGRVSLNESEAAASMGVPSHVLRDARYRLKLKHGRTGRSVLYTSEQLQAALQTMTVNAESSEPSL